MSSSSNKSLRLSFKGEKPPKKCKRSREQAGANSRKRKLGAGSDVEDVDGDEQAWVAVEREPDLTGPCFIFQERHCLAFQPTLETVEAAVMVSTELAIDGAELQGVDARLAEELDGAEIVTGPSTNDDDARTRTPVSVSQVWIATQVPDSMPARYTFKCAEGMFLGADKSGAVRANMQARGPQEEWSLETSTDGRWKLRSVHGGYLGLDHAGRKTSIRADCHDTQLQWSIKVQWKHRHAARHAAQPKGLLRTQTHDPTAVQSRMPDQRVAHELETLKSRAGSQYLPPNYASSLSKDERRALRRADKQGRLAEEMLDRRSKLKSDKYA